MASQVERNHPKLLGQLSGHWLPRRTTFAEAVKEKNWISQSLFFKM